MSRKAYRDLDGVVVLDKPLGESSNRSLQRIRHLFRAAKAGHTGSLDPLASGVLPLCFGEATKFSSYLLDADKTYEVEARLGVKTSTGDAEGEVIERQDPPQFSKRDLDLVLSGFIGPIQQIPPMYSALKHNGQPLYKLARQGTEIDRMPRQIQIYSLALSSFDENTFKLVVRCSKGTYIRTLIEDVCEKLGTVGHVSMLRRTAAGMFTLDDSWTASRLESLVSQMGDDAVHQCLLPPQVMVAHWSRVDLSDSEALRLLRGQVVILRDRQGCPAVQIFGPDEKFLGVGEIIGGGRLMSSRLIRTSFQAG